MSILNAFGYTFLESLLKKLQRKIHENELLHDNFKMKILRYLSIMKVLLPFIVQFHLVMFYWHGTFYDIAKRITRIRYVSISFGV